jgi:hypothetical protein
MKLLIVKLHSPVTSFLLGQNILHRTLFSNTLSLCFLYRATVKYVVNDDWLICMSSTHYHIVNVWVFTGLCIVDWNIPSWQYIFGWDQQHKRFWNSDLHNEFRSTRLVQQLGTLFTIIKFINL